MSARLTIPTTSRWLRPTTPRPTSRPPTTSITFVLKSYVETLVGSAANDVFRNITPDALNSGDVIHGSAGNDTLDAVLAISPSTPSVLSPPASRTSLSVITQSSFLPRLAITTSVTSVPLPLTPTRCKASPSGKTTAPALIDRQVSASLTTRSPRTSPLPWSKPIRAM